LELNRIRCDRCNGQEPYFEGLSRYDNTNGAIFWLFGVSQIGCDLIPYGKGDLPWDHQFRLGQIFAPPIFAGLPSDAATTVRYADCLRWQPCKKR